MQANKALESRETGGEPSIVMVAGLPFHRVTREGAVAECMRLMEHDRAHTVVTANADFVAQAGKNPKLREIIFHADRIFCDGQPLVWLSRLFKYPLPERVTGSDLIGPLLGRCEAAGKSVYFFGGAPEVLDQLRLYLEKHYPSLRIAGMTAPPVGAIDDWDNPSYIREIRKARADLMVVALGCPKQEEWIHRFHQRYGVPLSIGVGGSLDFLVGRQTRAPKWVQQAGMEWAWRLGTNPRRLFGRYLRDFFALFRLTVKQWIAQHMKTNTSETPSNLINPALDEWELVILRGDLDAARAATLEDPGIQDKPLVIECSGVTFIDSSGLGKLIQWARRARAARQPICLLNPSRPVSFLIHSVNLEGQFPSAKTVWGVSAIVKQAASPSTGDRTKTPFRIRPEEENLDATTIPDLESSVMEAAENARRHTRIEVDMSTVSIIDSFAIGRLINMKRRLWQDHRELVLVNLSSTVTDVLRLLRLERVLTQEGDGTSLPGPNRRQTRPMVTNRGFARSHPRSA
jgi:N-acetylglucosaminyldiphosphoundecaprenol N-acetyl-beta-D-mannosaminyltransferase